MLPYPETSLHKKELFQKTLWLANSLGGANTLDTSRERIKFDANPDQQHHSNFIEYGLAHD